MAVLANIIVDYGRTKNDVWMNVRYRGEQASEKAELARVGYKEGRGCSGETETPGSGRGD